MKRKQERQRAVRKKVADGIARGASTSEIAKSIGKSEAAVRRIKREAGIKEMRDAEIMAYRKQGMTIDAIVEKLKGTPRRASKSTVMRVIRRHREEQEQLKEETSD